MCRNVRYPSNDEIAHTLESHPGIRQFNSSTFAKSVKGLPGSLTIALRYVFGQHDSKLAAEFFDKLATGEGLRRDNPILILRDKLVDGEKGRGQEATAAFTIKAWNAFVAHETITPHGLWYRTGKSGEPFPKIAGVEYPIELRLREHGEERSQRATSDNGELSEVRS
jgi:hypothetical protein